MRVISVVLLKVQKFFSSTFSLRPRPTDCNDVGALSRARLLIAPSLAGIISHGSIIRRRIGSRELYPHTIELVLELGQILTSFTDQHSVETWFDSQTEVGFVLPPLQCLHDLGLTGRCILLGAFDVYLPLVFLGINVH